MADKDRWGSMRTLRALTMVLGAGMVMLLGTAGCETDAQSGALIGAGLGAVIGQAIGQDTTGTLIGAGVGGAVGYGIGNESDKKKERNRNRDDW